MSRSRRQLLTAGLGGVAGLALTGAAPQHKVTTKPIGDEGVGPGEDHEPETHLIPLILRAAAGRTDHVEVFGTDYPTRDGTAVRDYIHVEDLGRAHALALDAIEPGRHRIYNLGTGDGYTVKEVVETARRVTGREIVAVDEPRRAGDPPALVAASDRIRAELGWTPEKDLDDMVVDAWAWHQAHPGGYDD